MLGSATIAAFLLVCLGFFISANLHNILVVHGSIGSMKTRAEVGRPSGLVVGAAAVGTVAYFLLASTYLFLAFTGR